MKVSDYIYYLWLNDAAITGTLSGEQGYLCLKRFLQEGEGK